MTLLGLQEHWRVEQDMQAKLTPQMPGPLMYGKAIKGVERERATSREEPMPSPKSALPCRIVEGGA